MGARFVNRNRRRSKSRAAAECVGTIVTRERERRGATRREWNGEGSSLALLLINGRVASSLSAPHTGFLFSLFPPFRDRVYSESPIDFP